MNSTISVSTVRRELSHSMISYVSDPSVSSLDKWSSETPELKEDTDTEMINNVVLKFKPAKDTCSTCQQNELQTSRHDRAGLRD